MQLRDYQQECIDAIVSHGDGRWLCQLATGLGKTVIFANVPQPGRTLILSHRRELVEQPCNYFSGGKKCSALMAGAKVDLDADVVSASVQSMKSQKYKFPKDHFHTIIIDEAHHAAATAYQNAIDYFDAKRILGFTATPNRGDGVGLECVFDDIIFKRDLKFGISNGYLSRIECKRVNIGYDIGNLWAYHGDYSSNELSRALNVDYCNDAIAKIVSDIATPPVLIFACDVKHAKDLASHIPGAVAVSAENKDRREIIADFRSGKIPVLVNCALFTEGTDIPEVRTVIIARPTKSNALYAQMVGRGTRLAPGKDKCLLVDCVGVSDKPICTAPTLVGLDPATLTREQQEHLEGDLLNDIPDIIQHETTKPASWIKSVRAVDIFARSCGFDTHGVAYSKDPDGSITVSLPGKRIWITPINHVSMAKVCTSKNYESGMLPYQDCLDLVFRTLRNRCSDAKAIWSKDGMRKWGRQPITPNQHNMIRYLTRLHKVPYEDIPEELTRQEASIIIDKLKRYRELYNA